LSARAWSATCATAGSSGAATPPPGGRIDRLEERHAQEMADMTARILELHELVLSTVIDIRDRVAGLEGLVAGYMRPDNAKPARRRTG
jgi:hypothetical protein